MPPTSPHPSETEIVIRRIRGPGIPLLRNTWRASMTEETWAEVLAGLDEPARALLSRPPDVTIWVDAHLVLRLTESMKRQSPRGLAHLQGIMTAEQMTTGPEAVPFSDADSLLAQFHLFWPRYFEGGRAEGIRTGTTRGDLIVQAAFPERWLFDFIEAWLAQILKAFGHGAAQVTYTPPPDGKPNCHTYHLEWG